MRGRSPKGRVASGALWVSVETCGTQLIQFGIFVVLSRLLGPEAYGLLGLASIVSLCARSWASAAGGAT
jgi:O-antigen/teichoic acid export membrane protein